MKGKVKIRYLILCVVFISLIFIPLTFSKYTEKVNTKVTLNIRSPKYTIKYNSNDGIDHILPKEYLPVEYIEANGTQWIDTGLKMNGDYTIYMDGYIPEGKSGVLVNGYQSNSERQGVTFYANSNKYGFYWYGQGYTTNETLTSVGINLKNRFQVTQDKNGITLNQHHLNVTDTYSGSSGTSNTNIYIFNTDADSSYKYGAIYHAKIYDGSREIRNFIPSYRKEDKVIGLYDTIEGIFYENAGTGTFLRGIIHGADGKMDDEEFTYGVSKKLKKNAYIKEDFIFKGWNTKADGTGTQYSDEQEILNLSSVDGDEITLYAQWVSDQPAIFQTNGEDMLRLMKMYANNDTELGNHYTEFNDNITAFRRATVEQYEAIEDNLTMNNLVSSESSEFDIFMWFDDGTIYYYTEANKVAINGSAAKMFARMSNLVDISGLADFDMSNATDMNRMFQDDYSLVDLSPLANWDTSNVTDMTFMFGANTNSNSNTMSITSLKSLANWDTSKVTSFNQTFKLCGQLTTLEGLENWDVSSATNFAQMFNRANLNDALAIKEWNVKKTSTSSTFNMMLANNPNLTNAKKPIFTNLPGTWTSNGTYNPK